MAYDHLPHGIVCFLRACPAFRIIAPGGAGSCGNTAASRHLMKNEDTLADLDVINLY